MLMLLSSSVPAPSGSIPFLCPSSGGQNLCQLYLLGTLPSCFDPAFNQLLKAAALDDHSTLVDGHTSIFSLPGSPGIRCGYLRSLLACSVRADQ